MNPNLWKRKAITDLIELLIGLNRAGFTVFVDYSGHIEQLSIRCYPSGWRPGVPVSPAIYLDGRRSEIPYPAGWSAREPFNYVLRLADDWAARSDQFYELGRRIRGLSEGTSRRGASASGPSKSRSSYYQRNKEKMRAYYREYHRRRRAEMAASRASATESLPDVPPTVEAEAAETVGGEP